jgi:hypothetical protein
MGDDHINVKTLFGRQLHPVVRKSVGMNRALGELGFTLKVPITEAWMM